MKKQIVVNLFGGPGSGKSTTAAGVFSMLKLHGINVELVTEFAKDLTWESRHRALENQYYIWGKQYHKLFRVKHQVEVIVTDSPLLLSLLYCGDSISTYFDGLVNNTFKEFNNVNFFLNRIKEYNPSGRNQTEEEAKEIDTMTKQLLGEVKERFEEVPGDLGGINYITGAVLSKYLGIKDIKVGLVSI